MYKIACLGTMHTYGGQKTLQYPFENTWPGILSDYLTEKTIPNHVYNGGESGFSIQYYPYKILNFFNEFKPNCFIIELPIMDKIDVEVSSAITGEYINQNENYHPIFSRQRVQTKDWEKGQSYIWSNRITMSKQEILDAFADSDAMKQFKGHVTSEYKNFLQELDIGDHERANVKNKLDRIKQALPPEGVKLLENYLHFIAMYTDESDTDTISYLSHLNNVIQTCKALGVNYVLFNVNRAQWLTKDIYTETYKEHIHHDKNWVPNISWCMNDHYDRDPGGYHTIQSWRDVVNKHIGPRICKTIQT